MKITKLDKPALIALREPLGDALKDFGERFGLDITVGNGGYTPDGADATFKIELKVNDPEVKLAAAKAQWDRNCQYVGIDFAKPDETGLRPEDFGTEFTQGGITYRTNAIAVGRSKYPVGVEVLNGPKMGKNVFFTEHVVPVIRRATDAKAAGLPGFSAFADKKAQEAAEAKVA